MIRHSQWDQRVVAVCADACYRMMLCSQPPPNHSRKKQQQLAFLRIDGRPPSPSVANASCAASATRPSVAAACSLLIIDSWAGDFLSHRGGGGGGAGDKVHIQARRSEWFQINNKSCLHPPSSSWGSTGVEIGSLTIALQKFHGFLLGKRFAEKILDSSWSACFPRPFAWSLPSEEERTYESLRCSRRLSPNKYKRK